MLGFKKKEEKKVKGESFMQGVMALMVSQVLIKLLGLVYKWYLTNREGFGDEGNAIYSAGFSIYALLLTISSTGVPNAVARLVSQHIAKEDYRGAHRVFKIAFVTFIPASKYIFLTSIAFSFADFNSSCVNKCLFSSILSFINS